MNGAQVLAQLRHQHRQRQGYEYGPDMKLTHEEFKNHWYPDNKQNWRHSDRKEVEGSTEGTRYLYCKCQDAHGHPCPASIRLFSTDLWVYMALSKEQHTTDRCPPAANPMIRPIRDEGDGHDDSID